MKHHNYKVFFNLLIVITLSITLLSCEDGGTDPVDIDIAAPVITAGPTVTTLDSSATIIWTTNEIASSKVMWDTDSSTLSNEMSDTALTLSHEIILTSLAPVTKYFYQITSADEAGNDTSSEAGLNFTTKYNFSTAISIGWSTFESGDYEAADTLFAISIMLNDSIPAGYNGAGWTKGRLGDDQGSVDQFQIGSSLDSTDLDIKAGLSFALNAAERFEESIPYARYFYDQDTSWTFSHDPTLTTDDLILLLAINYFSIADFESSLFFVQILNPSFYADVSLPDGRNELFSEIERLRSFT